MNTSELCALWGNLRESPFETLLWIIYIRITIKHITWWKIVVLSSYMWILLFNYINIDFSYWMFSLFNGYDIVYGWHHRKFVKPVICIIRPHQYSQSELNLTEYLWSFSSIILKERNKVYANSTTPLNPYIRINQNRILKN